MKLTLCLALALAAPGAALAADPAPAPQSAPPAQSAPPPATAAPAPAPVPAPPPDIEGPPDYLPPPPPPPPRGHWVRYRRQPVQTPEELEAERQAYDKRGGRPAWYADMMIAWAGYAEDPDYRLTTRKTRLLEGGSGLIRLGGVIDAHNRVGVRMQGFLRPTRALVRDNMLDHDWGSVQVGFIGPEYIYTTTSGVYAAASVGFAGASSSLDHSSCNDSYYYGRCDHGDGTLRSSFGGGALASLGYEWRLRRWLTLSAEAFGGVLFGLTDQEKSTQSEVFGVGVGVGF